MRSQQADIVDGPPGGARGGGAQVVRELDAVLRRIDDERVAAVARRIVAARNVVCAGAGREGLMMRALVMRLFHAGVDAHVVGDMTCPAVGPGDLAVLSLGPGRLRTIETLATIAKDAGADTVCLTAEPDRVPIGLFDEVLVVEAQTMASDAGSTSVLPMGSAFEIAELVLTDLITNQVRAALGEDVDAMRARHTNLE
ncbi:6-phospho-3-hexuloisomerase [Curtobacterium sp. VKM Ac-1376]|uniref:6-phospho-3-hexuloisomerase n=1 Tax=Curtobacterium sp. VKM Ac-1376 TaxID=123312 RepID=UPI00188C4686|nr:6-phospho-3-hexuloisomerase [Curtobacterium sp. VKM Ac-1376]MBF4615930.1 6-phospho-3-hexuloisomerase [Curtobacterium sp. VKM Ac-1376]